MGGQAGQPLGAAFRHGRGAEGPLPPIQTTLCNTSLDNPTQRDKGQLIRAALKFLDTDTVW